MALKKKKKILPIIQDEVDWVYRENKHLEELLPKKNRNIWSKLVIVIFIIFMMIKFNKISVLIIFLSIASYIKFKRAKRSIHLEIEPTYLFLIVLTISYGLIYGIVFIFLREILASVARFNKLIIQDISTKLAVILIAHLMWNSLKINIVIPILIVIFIFEIFNYFIKIKFGQKKYEALSATISHFFFRWIYFSIFLEPLLKIM
ncbi:hypothetical protein HOD20_09450 [archaeon]|nr:hypothetical protein [archaeon]MBT4646966.1 hypothetical protein [archaeon]MBT6822561.1 hypothetical protein [archaeon]MBT7392746.1 hypothetical protein [archaeon]